MTPKKRPSVPTPYLRFYNEAAADDNVARDRIYGQVYNEENQGYGSNLTLQQLFDRAQDDPQLASTLSEMFMIEGADKRGFTDRFTRDVDFARMYADVEGSRGGEQTFKTIAPKYRGDRSLPDNQGEKGCGADMACSPSLAKKVAKERTAKGATAKDKIKARIQAAMILRQAPTYERTQSTGTYDRFGERIPDEYRSLALTNMADRDVGNLMMMLGTMPGQGNRQYLPADRIVSSPSFAMNGQ